MKSFLFVIAVCFLIGAADYLYPLRFHDPVRIIAILTWSLDLTLPLMVIFGWFNPSQMKPRLKFWIGFNAYWYVAGLSQLFFPQMKVGSQTVGWLMLVAAIAITIFSVRYRKLFVW